MYVTWQTLITIGAVISALLVIFGLLFKGFNWYKEQQKQSEEIKHIKKENALICYALLACLDGLEQLGCNHSVPTAKEKLEKHLNQQAHE